MMSYCRWNKASNQYNPVHSAVTSQFFRRKSILRTRQTRLRKNIQLPPRAAQYVYIVLFNNGPHDVSFFFCNPTHCVKNLIDAPSNASIVVAKLFDTGGGPSLINKDFLPLAWEDFIKSTRLPQMQTANCNVFNIESIWPLFTCIGDLCVRAWFRIVDNLAVDILLGTSFIDRCIQRTFRTECEIGPSHSESLRIILTKTSII